MPYMTKEEYEEWKRNGWLTDKACKQFYIGTCPRGIALDNPQNTTPCKTCTIREH